MASGGCQPQSADGKGAGPNQDPPKTSFKYALLFYCFLCLAVIMATAVSHSDTSCHFSAISSDLNSLPRLMGSGTPGRCKKQAHLPLGSFSIVILSAMTPLRFVAVALVACVVPQ